MRKHRQKQTQTTAILRRCSLLFIVSIILLGSCTKYTPSGPVVSTVRDTIYTPPLPAVQVGDINPTYSGNVADYFKTPRVLYSMSGSYLVYFPGGGIRMPFISSEEDFRADVMDLYIRRQLERGEPIDSTLQYRDVVNQRIFRMSSGYPWTWGKRNSTEIIERIKSMRGLPSYVKGFNGGQMVQMEDGNIVFRQGEETDPWFPDGGINEAYPSGNFTGDLRWYFSQQEVSGNQMKLRGDSAIDDVSNSTRTGPLGFFRFAQDVRDWDNWNHYRLIVESDSLAFLLVMHPRKVNSKQPWKDSHEALIVLPNPYPKKPD